MLFYMAQVICKITGCHMWDGETDAHFIMDMFFIAADPADCVLA